MLQLSTKRAYSTLETMADVFKLSISNVSQSVEENATEETA